MSTQAKAGDSLMLNRGEINSPEARAARSDYFTAWSCREPSSACRRRHLLMTVEHHLALAREQLTVLNCWTRFPIQSVEHDQISSRLIAKEIDAAFLLLRQVSHEDRS